MPRNRKVDPAPLLRPASASGFTLVELLLVVAIMGIVTAVILPRLEPGITSQLESAGHLLVADLDYARQLAVANSSSYTVTFASDAASYTIAHSGDNSGLDVLPASPFRRPGDPPEEHIGRLDDLPQAGLRIRFWAVLPPTPTGGNQLEFGPLGALTQGTTTTIWLGAGDGRTRYYLPIQVNAATGLTTLGQPTTANPLAGKQLNLDD